MSEKKVSKARGFWEWLRGRINNRLNCPACGEWRTGVLIGEWGDEMRECCACKHYWTVPYAS